MREETLNPDGGIYYSSDIPDFVFNETETKRTFSLSDSSKRELIRESYTGEFYVIRELSKVITDDLKARKSLSDIYTFRFEYENGKVRTGSFSVYYCRVSIGLTPADRPPGFRTTGPCIKRTYCGAKEYVLHPAGDPCTIHALYRGAAEELRRETQTLAADPLREIDISPGRFRLDGWELIEYSIVCEDLSRTYIVELPRFARTVEFDNIFGVTDTAHFFFSQTGRSGDKREEGLLYGNYTSLSHERENETVLLSGSLAREELPHYESIAYADRLRIDAEEYVPTEVNTITGSDTGSAESCELKIKKIAGSNTLRLHPEPEGRIFDHAHNYSHT